MIRYDIDKASGELVTITIPEPETFLTKQENKDFPDEVKQNIFKKRNKENALENLLTRLSRGGACEFLDFSSDAEKDRSGVYLAMMEKKEINFLKEPPVNVPNYEAEKKQLQQAIYSATSRAERMELEVVAFEKSRDYKSAQLRNESKITMIKQAETAKQKLGAIIENEPAEIERHITELTEYVDFVIKAVVNPYKKKIKDAELRLANLQKKNYEA